MAQTLDRGRRQQNYSGGLAFETIAAFGPHAAQLHYTPSNKTDVEVTENGLLLIDSGGQYLGKIMILNSYFIYSSFCILQMEQRMLPEQFTWESQHMNRRELIQRF